MAQEETLSPRATGPSRSMWWHPQPLKAASLGMLLTWESSKAKSGLLSHPAAKLTRSPAHNHKALCVLTQRV